MSLEIISLELASNELDENELIHKVTTNQHLWEQPGQTPTLPFVTLGRILEKVGIVPWYAHMSKIEKCNELWITGPNNNQAPLTVDYLNERIVADTPPKATIVQSTEFPNLLTAHSSVVIGRCVMKALSEHENVLEAYKILTSPSSDHPYGMYRSGTLARILMDAGTDMAYAAVDIEDILTA